MEFIQEQLESILFQTCLPDEIVVSDDNSTDGTMSFAESYLKEQILQNSNLSGIRIKIMQNIPALGVSKNFENAINEATSDLIALADQDDVWAKNKLERILPIFEENPSALLVHTDASLISETGVTLKDSLFRRLHITETEIDQIKNHNAVSVLIKRNLVTGATAVFRSKLFLIAQPFPSSWLHDEWLGIVAACNQGVYLSSEKLIGYRQHANNQVGASKLGMRHFLGRILHPGLERNRFLLLRATELSNHQFLANMGKNNDLKQLMDRNFQHQQFRSRLQPQRHKRIKTIIKYQKKTQNYSIVGRGLMDVVRDLFQPLNR